MTEYVYRICDPTGNITALVDGDVEVARQPEMAQMIMRRHPEVEQVGFVQFQTDPPQLRMAGGEFCGNASMSAAAWYMQQREQHTCKIIAANESPHECHVTLSVSGATHPVRVHLRNIQQDHYRASVQMPWALHVSQEKLSTQDGKVSLPVVRMEGITHMIIEENTPFFYLKQERGHAEQAIRKWCAQLGADGLGLMFLEHGNVSDRLTPLVYIPVGDTIFWEHSCGSGSCAVGIYLALNRQITHISLEEPGGQMQVSCNPDKKEVLLYGQVALKDSYDISKKSL